MPTPIAPLGPAERRHFRDGFRAARAHVLRDAEAFDEILFALERLGQYVSGKQADLGRYHPRIAEALFPSPSPLAADFDRTYSIVREGRNHALHQGAGARHLAQCCVKLAIILEDKLSEDFMHVSDVMVAGPVCAALWHPLSFIRQSMLANSFSYLPFQDEEGRARILSDAALARYVRTGSGSLSIPRLAESLSDAVKKGLEVSEPVTLPEDATIVHALEKMRGVTPALVVRPNGEFIGILTPFDLL